MMNATSDSDSFQSHTIFPSIFFTIVFLFHFDLLYPLHMCSKRWMWTKLKSFCCTFDFFHLQNRIQINNSSLLVRWQQKRTKHYLAQPRTEQIKAKFNYRNKQNKLHKDKQGKLCKRRETWKKLNQLWIRDNKKYLLRKYLNILSFQSKIINL